MATGGWFKEPVVAKKEAQAQTSETPIEVLDVNHSQSITVETVTTTTTNSAPLAPAIVTTVTSPPSNDKPKIARRQANIIAPAPTAGGTTEGRASMFKVEHAKKIGTAKDVWALGKCRNKRPYQQNQ